MTQRSNTDLHVRPTRLRWRHRGFATSALTAALTAALTSALWADPDAAQAYDLSRGFDSSDGKGGEEHVFVDVLVGAWLPGPLTFDSNHMTSLNFGGEVGVKVAAIRKHYVYVVGGMTLSPQTLEPHLDEESTTMVQGFAGVRYTPGITCLPNDGGCAFVEVSLGLTWDTVADEPGHGAPKGELTVNAGLGYRFHLGEHFHLGARLDIGYLEEDYTRQLGWLNPSLFGGARF